MALGKPSPRQVNRSSLLFLSLALVMSAACTHDTRVDTDFGVKQRPSSPDTCPDDLLEPGPNARSQATWTAMQWAESHQDSEASGFKVTVAPARGHPQGPCKASVWDKSWVAIIRWKYPPNSPAADSASLASSTIFEGRTARSRAVWRVWFQFH